MSTYIIIALYLLGIVALICETKKAVQFPLVVFFILWPVAALVALVSGLVGMMIAAVRK